MSEPTGPDRPTDAAAISAMKFALWSIEVPSWGSELQDAENSQGKRITQADWTHIATELVRAAAQAGTPPDAVRAAAAAFLAAVDLLSDYALPEPAVLARQRLREVQAGTAPADPLWEETNKLLTALSVEAGSYAAGFSSRHPIHRHLEELRARVKTLREAKATLAVGAPAAPTPETDIERADDWTDNEGAGGTAPGRAPAPEPDVLECLRDLLAACTAEVNEKGAGGYLLARMSDARNVIARVSGGAPPAAPEAHLANAISSMLDDLERRVEGQPLVCHEWAVRRVLNVLVTPGPDAGRIAGVLESIREAARTGTHEITELLAAARPAEPNWKALGRSVVEAAQEVIGQCDCIMAETSERDPKRIWQEARDAYLRAAPPPEETTESRLKRVREDLTWHVGWAAKNDDNEAMALFFALATAIDNVLDFCGLRAAPPPSEAPRG